MKKISVFILTIFFLLSLNSISNQNGSVGGKTGSPGDNGVLCTQCHAGTSNTGSGIAEIITNIPSSGYIPGQTYEIKAKISEFGTNKFGFELTAEKNTNDAKIGDFSLVNTSHTKLVDSNDAVTQLTAGTAPINGGDFFREWTMNWTAPVEGTGDITFYAAFNAANGNGQNTSDNIYTVSHLIGENNLSLHQNNKNLLTVYPNPANDYIIIEGNNAISRVEFVNLEGRSFNNLSINNNQRINIEAIPAGIYFIHLIDVKEQSFLEKLVIY